MPKITITEPFNHRAGGVTKHYQKGEQNVPQEVAQHAWAKNFATQPKAEPKAKASPAAGKAESPAAE